MLSIQGETLVINTTSIRGFSDSEDKDASPPHICVIPSPDNSIADISTGTNTEYYTDSSPPHSSINSPDHTFPIGSNNHQISYSSPYINTQDTSLNSPSPTRNHPDLEHPTEDPALNPQPGPLGLSTSQIVRQFDPLSPEHLHQLSSQSLWIP